MPSSVNDFFSFATTMEALKTLERFRGQYYWNDYPGPAKYESVADHSWRLAMLVVMFAEKLSQPIDLAKTLQMALMHDLPEIISGDESPMGKDGTGKDTHAFDLSKEQDKFEIEKRSAQQLFGKLPAAERDRLYATWLESELCETYEAKVVKALDKIEAMLQVLEYRRGNMFPEHLEFTIGYGLKYADVDPAIKEFGEHIAEQMRSKYTEFIS